ncbi:MAG: argininosuccinate lyase [SAR324 cluster bacterium]|uniref:Argininosuccinate lyase n=1 Tax=SAR324 cluster bacterium TaxID=2024889 RepID=A0A2A4SW55_9DELT|nr:MAG: argininosuccinate lyase [SAR324 cluster bacterium]
MAKKSQVWGGRLTTAPDKLNISFCAGRDVNPLPMADELLLTYDIWTNLAHISMLRKTEILSDEEHGQIKAALIQLQQQFEQGEFKLDPSKEDVHINVEHFVTTTQKVEAGKKIHTGRSRNDQVSTDMRLYMRAEALELVGQVMTLVRAILQVAEQEKESLMPGFTHYQPAMLTTVAHWLTSWSQGLIRDCQRLLQDLVLLNRSPLGAAASFGTSWPIDREHSAALLGFDGVEENTLDCISSRGENEARLASTVSLLMNHLSTISQDIILLSTPYYNMLVIDDRFVTGSSIMPQKRNPDFAEVIRSKAAVSHGILTSLLGIQKGSMSGYNRDTQQTKYLVMDLFRESMGAPLILAGVIETMTFQREEMLKQCEFGFMNSADVADWLAREFALSFRDCYELLSLAVRYSEKAGKLTDEAMAQAIQETGLPVEITSENLAFLNTPAAMLDKKVHTGAPSPVATQQMIENQQHELEKLAAQQQQIEAQAEAAKKQCFQS